MYFKMYRQSAGLLGGQWRWTLYATNDEPIANGGESYHNEADCLHAINLVRGTNSTTPIKK